MIKKNAIMIVILFSLTSYLLLLYIVINVEVGLSMSLNHIILIYYPIFVLMDYIPYFREFIFGIQTEESQNLVEVLYYMYKYRYSPEINLPHE